MAPRKSERIMNLAICLLMARRFLDKNHIREVVEGYAGLSDAAFERTFERDKDDLRAMGVPVETGSNSTLFPDEIGYRIRRQDFELPPIDFTGAEATALVNQTFVGSAALLAESGRSATQLREMVTSPAGTTAAALRALDDAGVRARLREERIACHGRGFGLCRIGPHARMVAEAW